MSTAESAEAVPLVRIYASDWSDEVRRGVVDAACNAGYRFELGELGEGDSLPADTAIFVFGEQVGCRAGIELCRAARRAEETAGIPVILFGQAEQVAIHEGWKAGAAAYLTDPLVPDFHVCISRLLAVRAQRRGSRSPPT
ncbi:MAG: hypothetical protein PVH68_09105 [Armatimonadota bacterium]|jgi:DNA-binding response OmpR family regulator